MKESLMNKNDVAILAVEMKMVLHWMGGAAQRPALTCNMCIVFGRPVSSGWWWYLSCTQPLVLRVCAVHQHCGICAMNLFVHFLDLCNLFAFDSCCGHVCLRITFDTQICECCWVWANNGFV